MGEAAMMSIDERRKRIVFILLFLLFVAAVFCAGYYNLLRPDWYWQQKKLRVTFISINGGMASDSGMISIYKGEAGIGNPISPTIVIGRGLLGRIRVDRKRMIVLYSPDIYYCFELEGENLIYKDEESKKHEDWNSLGIQLFDGEVFRPL